MLGVHANSFLMGFLSVFLWLERNVFSLPGINQLKGPLSLSLSFSLSLSPSLVNGRSWLLSNASSQNFFVFSWIFNKKSILTPSRTSSSCHGQLQRRQQHIVITHCNKRPPPCHAFSIAPANRHWTVKKGPVEAGSPFSHQALSSSTTPTHSTGSHPERRHTGMAGGASGFEERRRRFTQQRTTSASDSWWWMALQWCTAMHGPEARDPTRPVHSNQNKELDRAHDRDTPRP